MIFAINSVLRLFGDSSLLGIDLAAIPYPPIRLRRAIIAETVATCFSKKNAELLNTVGPATVQATIDAELAFQAITGVPADLRGWRDEPFGDAGMKHMSRLAKNWKTKLRDELRPFAYKELPD